MSRAARERRRILDAIAFAVVVAMGVVFRRPVRPVGDEERRPLPGDELLPNAKGRWTHAVTIDASQHTIWPWLVQMGCRRGGWYSYDGLDNGGSPSADRIVSELQRPRVGDIFPMTPTAEDGFVVRVIEPQRALVLADPSGSATWAFLLEPIRSTHSRLIVRIRASHEGFAVGLMIELLLRPIHFGMQRKQLLNIRRRVQEARSSAAT